jgi:NAD(P)-dependent dehydrogenase (short-subunit alcohol dehydrogenase family)
MEMTEKKVALVTGVSSGIGRVTAQLLADRGSRMARIRHDAAAGQSPTRRRAGVPR